MELSHSVMGSEASIFPGTALAERSRPARTPLWLWWNLLSADAPTVAFLWALLFARAARVSLPLLEAAVLAATVWVIYVGDRLLDGKTGARQSGASDRHAFYVRHRALAWGCLAAVSAAALWVSVTRLEIATRRAGLELAAAVALYFLLVHGARGGLSRLFPKELLVGGIFAAGTLLPAGTRGAEAARALLAPALLFGAVCALNCMAIECWEHHRGGRQWSERPRWLLRWADARIAALAGSLLAAAGFSAFFAPRDPGELELLAACALSLIFLLALDRASHRLSPRSLRVLADAALLTPALFLLKGIF